MAAEISQRVLDMVRRELVQNPDVDNSVLYAKARDLDPAAMKDVDRRQFNARYPLRVKRFEMKARKPKPKSRSRSDGEAPKRRRRQTPAAAAPAATGPAGPDSVTRQLVRDSVRDVLLRFAQDLANAESRGDIVGVVASVDRYVDQVLGLGAFPE